MRFAVYCAVTIQNDDKTQNEKWLNMQLTSFTQKELAAPFPHPPTILSSQLKCKKD